MSSVTRPIVANPNLVAPYGTFAVSPLNCIQELVQRDLHYPWRVLVVCAFLNQTHGRGVRPIIDEFFELVPTPEAMLKTSKESIDHLLRPLGFHNRRYITLFRMSQDYVRIHERGVELGKPTPFGDMYGVGPYALDSIDLFVHGMTGPLRSNDTWLRPYREWRLAGGPMVRWDIDGYRSKLQGRTKA